MYAKAVCTPITGANAGRFAGLQAMLREHSEPLRTRYQIRGAGSRPNGGPSQAATLSMGALEKDGALMATKWEYRTAENFQQADETRTESALRRLNANGREGWEFIQILDFGEGEFLLFRRQSSN